MSERICISDMTLDALTAYIVGLGQPKFRAKQIFKWLHQKLVTEFAQMTDQPKTLLAALEEQCTIAAPSIRRRQQSKDGTVKYLLQLADGNCIETVLMRYKYGNTVCVSTQVGCAMGCRFCASTQAGRVRDLTAGEIASEIYTAQKDSGERVSHIVLMGIGEPLHNFNNVMDFLEIISCPEGVNIGMRNISLSTCGLVPKIDELAKRHLQLTLSVSLHAPDNKTRSGMMPVNDAFPLEQLIPACRRYQKETGRRISLSIRWCAASTTAAKWRRSSRTLSRAWAHTSTLSPSTRWTAALILPRMMPMSTASRKNWKRSASTPRCAAAWAPISVPPAASCAARMHRENKSCF